MNININKPEGKKGSNKLRTYKLFKENIQLEYYLTAVAAVRYRIALTRIPVSCHSLAIETGRYQKPTSLAINLLYVIKSKTKYILYAYVDAMLISEWNFLALCKVYTLYFSSCHQNIYIMQN